MLHEILDTFLTQKAFFGLLLVEHMGIALCAIVIAVVIGGIFGIVISEYRKASTTALGVVNFLYTIPSISMLGFLIPFSGVGNVTAIIALTIYALLPMVRNTYVGITQIDAAILEAAEGMGSTRWQMLYKIKLPLAFPVIVSGVRTMMTMTIALGGIASFIGAGGLGVAIYRGIATNNTAMTMVGSLLIALLALGLDFAMGFFERSVGATSKRSMKKIVTVAAMVLCVFVLAAGASFFSGQSKQSIRIATKSVTEHHILSEMLALLIEQETDLHVELTQGVGGGTANMHPATEKGDFDLYIDYTGTGWNMVLKKGGLYTEDLFPTLQQEYGNRYNMQWLGMYGFNNTYGIAVRADLAKQYNLKTYSDLRTVNDKLVFGAGYDFFGRQDGFDMLCETYDLAFADTVDMDFGLKYQAMAEGKIDVMTIFTTDGQLGVADVVVLIDDKQMYPSYRCGNIVRTEFLQKHPELYDVLELIQGRISDSAMATLNYQVEGLGKDPADVAKDFLQTQGLLK